MLIPLAAIPLVPPISTLAPDLRSTRITRLNQGRSRPSVGIMIVVRKRSIFHRPTMHRTRAHTRTRTRSSRRCSTGQSRAEMLDDCLCLRLTFVIFVLVLDGVVFVMRGVCEGVKVGIFSVDIDAAVDRGRRVTLVALILIERSAGRSINTTTDRRTSSTSSFSRPSCQSPLIDHNPRCRARRPTRPTSLPSAPPPFPQHTPRSSTSHRGTCPSARIQSRTTKPLP
jgi:hypothetical protein